MIWDKPVTELPSFKAALGRIQQIDALLLALEHAAEGMDITCVECALIGIRALAIQACSELETTNKTERELIEGK